MCRSGRKWLPLLLLVFFCWPVVMVSADTTLTDAELSELTSLLSTLQTESAKLVSQLKEAQSALTEQQNLLETSRSDLAESVTALQSLRQQASEQERYLRRLRLVVIVESIAVAAITAIAIWR